MELFDLYDLDTTTHTTVRGTSLETTVVFGHVIDAAQEYQAMMGNDDDDMTSRYAEYNRYKETLEHLL